MGLVAERKRRLVRLFPSFGREVKGERAQLCERMRNRLEHNKRLSPCSFLLILIILILIILLAIARSPLGRRGDLPFVSVYTCHMSSETNCVYIMSTMNNNVLYTGVTSNLFQRVLQHKMGTIAGFTSKYKVYKLVYYECGDDIRDAILREKQIKDRSRAYKESLINSMNPEWKDLSEDWY